MNKSIFALLKNIKTEQEVKDFFKNLFTKNEIDILHKRWRILELLKSGMTQRDIAKELNVSLCKVTRGAKILKDKNSIVSRFLNEE